MMVMVVVVMMRTLRGGEAGGIRRGGCPWDIWGCQHGTPSLSAVISFILQLTPVMVMAETKKLALLLLIIGVAPAYW